MVFKNIIKIHHHSIESLHKKILRITTFFMDRNILEAEILVSEALEKYTRFLARKPLKIYKSP